MTQAAAPVRALDRPGRLRPAVALIRHSLARMRALLLALIVLLAVFQVLFVLAAATLHRSGTFEQIMSIIPPLFRDVMGDSLAVFMSFSGLVAFGYFHPIILAALCGVQIALATEIAGEVESRFVDVILARPLPRHVPVTRSVSLVLLVPAAFLLAMMAGSFGALAALQPSNVSVPGLPLIGSLALNAWALLACIGGVTLAASSVSRRRSVVAGAAGLVSVALFLVDYLSRVWEPVRHVAWVSPFRYFAAMDLVMGRPLPPWHIEVLLSAAALGIGSAYVLFSRRDL